MRVTSSSGRAAALTALLWASASAALAQERLVLDPYPGPTPWREVTRQVDGAKLKIERMPADQSPQNVHDMLAAESFPGLKSIDPSAFIRGVFGHLGAACQSLRVNGPVAQTEAGVVVAYGQIYCGRQQGSSFGSQTFLKAIQGQDALYVIKRTMLVPASDAGGVLTFSKDQAAAAMALMQSAAQANQYLSKSVYLCGGASSDPRCAPAAP